MILGRCMKKLRSKGKSTGWPTGLATGPVHAVVERCIAIKRPLPALPALAGRYLMAAGALANGVFDLDLKGIWLGKAPFVFMRLAWLPALGVVTCLMGGFQWLLPLQK